MSLGICKHAFTLSHTHTHTQTQARTHTHLQETFWPRSQLFWVNEYIYPKATCENLLNKNFCTLTGFDVISITLVGTDTHTHTNTHRGKVRPQCLWSVVETDLLFYIDRRWYLRVFKERDLIACEILCVRVCVYHYAVYQSLCLTDKECVSNVSVWWVLII